MLFECLATSSKGNCYIVESGGSNFLLDAGISIESITKHINLNDVDFAFVSHKHKDHSASKNDLKERGVYIIDGSTNKEWSTIQNIGRHWWKASTFKVFHGKEDCSALMLKTEEDFILYATDFSKCNWSLKQFKFNHIIVECNYDEKLITQQMIDSDMKIKRQINTHMGVDGLCTFLDSLDLENLEDIIICHMSSSDSIFNQNDVVNQLYARYRKPIGCCQQFGGIEWIGKDEFNYE